MSYADVPENPHAGHGMVVLDIGGDVGALVVSTPAALVGAELEICPSGCRDAAPDEGRGWWHGDWRSHHNGDDHAHPHAAAWPHVSVLTRPSPDGTQHAAVFPGLRAGDYDVWVRPDGTSSVTATVLGGEVTTAEWVEP